MIFDFFLRFLSHLPSFLLNFQFDNFRLNTFSFIIFSFFTFLFLFFFSFHISFMLATWFSIYLLFICSIYFSWFILLLFCFPSNSSFFCSNFIFLFPSFFVIPLLLLSFIILGILLKQNYFLLLPCIPFSINSHSHTCIFLVACASTAQPRTRTRDLQLYVFLFNFLFFHYIPSLTLPTLPLPFPQTYLLLQIISSFVHILDNFFFFFFYEMKHFIILYGFFNFLPVFIIYLLLGVDWCFTFFFYFFKKAQTTNTKKRKKVIRVASPVGDAKDERLGGVED